MSVLKTLLDVTLSDGMKLVSEARRRVKPYLPLAAELYNELATRVPVSLPKVDVDKLIDDLYPKQDLDPAWAHDAEPNVPESPVDDEPEVFDDEPEAAPEAVPEVVEATPVSEPAPAPLIVEPVPVAEVVPDPPAVVVAPAPLPEPPAPVPVAAVPVAAVPVAKPAKVAKLAKATKPRPRKKDDAQQSLIAPPVPAKPRYTLEGLLEMKKTELLDLARELKLELKPSATKQALADAILAKK